MIPEPRQPGLPLSGHDAVRGGGLEHRRDVPMWIPRESRSDSGHEEPSLGLGDLDLPGHPAELLDVPEDVPRRQAPEPSVLRRYGHRIALYAHSDARGSPMYLLGVERRSSAVSTRQVRPEHEVGLRLPPLREGVGDSATELRSLLGVPKRHWMGLPVPRVSVKCKLPGSHRLHVGWGTFRAFEFVANHWVTRRTTRTATQRAYAHAPRS